MTQVVSVRFRRYALLLAVLLTSLFLLTVQTRGGGATRAADLVALAIIAVAVLILIVWGVRRLLRRRSRG